MQVENSSLKRLEEAKKWALDAGEFIKVHLHDELQIDSKTNFTDLVTNLDKEVQEKIISEIERNFPKDKVLAEEEANGHQSCLDKKAGNPLKKHKNLWLIDPIDGTSNFVVQKSDFAVMIAYYQDGIGQFGIIYDVIAGNLYWNDANQVYRNDTVLTLPQKTLRESLLSVSTSMYRNNDYHLVDLAFETIGVRMFGSAGISYAKILDGKILAYASNLSPWDYAAGSILTGKLGWTTMSLSHSEITYSEREKIMTLPTHLLEEMLKIMKING